MKLSTSKPLYAMANKKRPQYMQIIINEANKQLEMRCVKDENDNLFNFICDKLMKMGMYQGFNYFKRVSIMVDGNEVTRLAYATKEEYEQGKWDCLQIM